MGKSKKKRNKQYRGAGARATSENLVRIRKVEAVARSDRAQWLYDHRSLLKKLAIGVAIAVVVIILIVSGIMAVAK